MSRDGRDRLRDGRLAILVGAVTWSSAGVIQRTLDTDAGTQIAGRAAFAAVTLLGLAIATERRGTLRAFTGMGPSGLAIATLTAFSSGTFLLALNHASVASVLFMQAVGPFLAALLGWLLLRERVERRTWTAMAIALAGVVLMVGGPGSGSALGHVLALAMTASFAAAVVVTRHRREVSMMPAACVSQVLVVVAAAPFASPGTLGGRDLLLTGAMGGGQIGLGLALLMVGARLIPPAEVAVISLLEVVLGPLWVWLAYGEQPGPATLAGGGAVVAAVAVQALGDLRASPRDGGAPGGRRGRLPRPPSGACACIRAMTFRIPDDLGPLSERELHELIKEATAEERRVSDRRNNLQDRLDFLRAGGGSTTSASDALVDKLSDDEQRVSDERKALHGVIDRLHAERMRRSSR